MSFIFSTRLASFFKFGWNSTAWIPRLVVSPPSLSHPDAPATLMARFPHFTPPRQVSALLASLVWSSAVFLAGQKHPSLLFRLCLTFVGDIKVVLPSTWRLNRPLYLRTEWIRWQRRSQLENDHRRRADRAPQITTSFTWDRRRAYWHT